ncbi:MAG TPA: sugar phosphate isomerase/epimerase family protein [Candidatus Dormibacteraeota bacterium]|jgi:sugar phosphate isomerase/epimerase|nr:sugar phosphate isomerase/epimerase family protein [Candidatus Dormibacteraeota bacterium]
MSHAMKARPRFAVSAATTYHSSFEEDVANYTGAGIAGIGLWEYKLRDGSDVERSDRLREAGLAVTYCWPLTPGIFPGNGLFSEPRDPARRLDMLCESIRRFAVYRPEAVCILAGAPLAGAESRSMVVSAFKRASRVAEEVGVELALEVISPGPAGSLVATIRQAREVIEDVGAENIGILLDTWHSADEPLQEIVEHLDHIVGIQVCDRADPSRTRFDRALPGTGILPLEAIIRAVDAAGYDSWYELEIFSDDGTFGQVVENSMWRWPPFEVVSAGRAAFETVYARATAAR